jgi:secretion/DNA translocation related TadE-like protein
VTPGCRGDCGSASVWVLACSALVLLIGVATSMRTSAVLARHRAESAADFAALAAAGRIGLGGDGCAAAAALAAANGATLVSCRAELGPDGRTGTVDVSVSLAVRLPVLGAERVIVTARAGRLAADSVIAPAGGAWPVAAPACDHALGCLARRARPNVPAEGVIAHAG